MRGFTRTDWEISRSISDSMLENEKISKIAVGPTQLLKSRRNLHTPVVKLDYDIGIADLQAVNYKLPRGRFSVISVGHGQFFPSHTRCLVAAHQNIKYHQASGMVKTKRQPGSCA